MDFSGKIKQKYSLAIAGQILMMKKEILSRSTRKVRFSDLKIDLSEFILKISLKIYRWARLKLRVRKDCGEKLGAVGGL